MAAYHKVSYYQYYVYINFKFLNSIGGLGKGNYSILGCMMLGYIETEPSRDT